MPRRFVVLLFFQPFSYFSWKTSVKSLTEVFLGDTEFQQPSHDKNGDEIIVGLCQPDNVRGSFEMSVSLNKILE